MVAHLFLLLPSFLTGIRDDKDVLTYYYADWCSPCVNFKNDLKNDKEIKQLLNTVKLIEIDCSDGSGKQVAREHQIYVFPTFILKRPDGVLINQWSGYSKNFFVEVLTSSIKDPLSIDEKIKLQKQEPSVSRAMFLAQFYQSKKEFPKALEYYEQAGALVSDPCVHLSQKFEISKLNFLFSSKSPSAFLKIEETLLSAIECRNVAAYARELAKLALDSQFMEKYHEWISIGRQFEKKEEPE